MFRPIASYFLITSLSDWGGGGCTWPGGMHRGWGEGDAGAFCASPLGKPLSADNQLLENILFRN
jgi:hypothetical protein